jgi:hypothetical protein
MGFTIETYSLYGLPPLQNIYVSIKGSYAVKKAPTVTPICVEGNYHITFTTYFQASPEHPVITQKDMSFNIQALPNPAVLYLIIYDYVKGQLDPHYMSNQQTLTFTDD